MDSHKTVVVFRVWPNDRFDVLALFPEEPYSAYSGLCMSYAHIGQHGSADYRWCIERTRPAKPEEYASLKRELESEPYGYLLDVRQRYTPKRKANDHERS